MAEWSDGALEFVVNHILLPPRLPSSRESDSVTREGHKLLIKLLEEQAAQWSRGPGQDAWTIISRMLSRVKTPITDSKLSSDLVRSAFRRMKDHDVLALPLRMQNAAVVFRVAKEKVLVEFFECAARSEDVLRSSGSLIHEFPAHGLSIPAKLLHDESFAKPLCFWLSQLDSQKVENVLPQMIKAGMSVGDARDTADPVLVTDMLPAILTPVAQESKPITVRKRVRDDVNCCPGQLPWRRSSLWLTLRVTIQVTLFRFMPAEQAMKQYKSFMITFLVALAGEVHQSSLAGELCHMVVAKVARRLCKSRSQVLPSVIEQASKTCHKLQSQHQLEWEAETSKDTLPVTTLDCTKFEQDSCLSLVNSKDYIMTAMARGFLEDSNRLTFSPSQSPLLAWADSLPALTEVEPCNADRIYTLGELEQWLQKHLSSWTERHLNSPRLNECTPLAKLVDRYYERALEVYRDDAQHMSTMIITVLQIWYAIDRLAVATLPLLGEFSPELQFSWFEPLLLPELLQMERLQEIERHVAKRHVVARQKASVFGTSGGDASFTHMYYNQKLECVVVKTENGTEMHDEKACPKCKLKKEADDLTIEVYEWPLPDSSNLAASVVVELDCPPALVAWRNVTWLLLHDLGRKGGVSAEYPKTTFGSHPDLQQFYVRQESRINLASTVQPMIKTQSGRLSFPVEKARCHMHSGMRWEMHDSTKNCWVAKQQDTIDFRSFCVLSMPSGLYSSLEFALGTNHTQNEVISRQNECPQDLSLQAYQSFGSLRADGERIQWLNIARELKAPHLNLNTPEVVSLFLQAAWQACSASDSQLTLPLRNAHYDLSRPDFAKELLIVIDRRFSLVQSNWRSDEVVRLLTTITLRVLSLTLDKSRAREALELLCQIRERTFQWTREIAEELARVEAPKESKVNSHMLIKSALLCKMTFAVDFKQQTHLMGAPSVIKYWTFCSVRLGEHLPGDLKLLPNDLYAMLVADRKFSHRLLPKIREHVVQHSDPGLNEALGLVYSDLTLSTGSWVGLDAPNDRWIQATSPRPNLNFNDTFHFNLLDAKLLINGQTSNRLPDAYTKHELYVRIFGDQVLSVAPSRMPGFIYMTCQLIEGHSIHFALFDDDLVIRSVRGNHTWELIPHNRFVGDIPHVLIEEYVHWLDVSSRTVELRPLKHLWALESCKWRLTFMANGTARLCDNDCRLLDRRSETHRKVMEIFKTLDTEDHVQATLRGGCLEVCLVRFDIHFSFIDGNFFCRELGKMVDPNQQVDTFIGLRNKLVLCGSGNLSKNYDRTVIIPNGAFKWSKGKSHISLHIEVEESTAKIFQYDIDPILQRLQDRGDHESILFKSYVHALTSHFLPDPLTNRTGTEEALSYLRRRSMKFSKAPKRAEICWLNKLAKLTPSRKYFPPSLKVMQQVSWDTELPTLTQHVGFLEAADEILMSGNSIQNSKDGNEIPSLYLAGERHLHCRAEIRGAGLQPAGLSPHIKPRAGESVYKCRDRNNNDTNSSKSLEMSSMVMSNPVAGKKYGDIQKFLKGLDLVEGFGTKYPLQPLLHNALKFDMKTQWAPLLYSLKSSNLKDDRYWILFLMGVLAYGDDLQDLMPLQQALAFAFSPELKALTMPTKVPFLFFKMGTSFVPSVIESHIDSAFHKVGRKGNAIERKKRKEELESAICRDKPKLISFYRAQWPCISPSSSDDAMCSKFDHEAANQKITEQFSIWIGNDKFGRYFEKVQAILRTLPIRSATPYQSHCGRDYETPIQNACPLAIPSLANLMSESAVPAMNPLDVWVQRGEPQSFEPDTSLTALLEQLDVNEGTHSLRRDYRNLLLESNKALSHFAPPMRPRTRPEDEEAHEHFASCEAAMKKFYDEIRKLLKPQDAGQELMRVCGLWPCHSVQSFLILLSSTSDQIIHPRWKECLIFFGQQILLAQRGRRIMLSCEADDTNEVHTELENEGPSSQTYDKYPDWLLIELDGDFLARQRQIEVTLEMISPASGVNSLIQLNMGEGKSSIIVPFVAVAIANKSQVARVVVLKPLLKQTIDTFQRRLGGLVDRRLCLIPFSRKPDIQVSEVNKIKTLHKECMSGGDVLITLPEHILSFKLQGVDRFIAGEDEVASALLRTQAFLENSCRDVFDESDELFDPMSQLIYSMGAQRMMDGQPDRWRDMQAIFGLIKEAAPRLTDAFPGEIEYTARTPSSFPSIRFLNPDRASSLLEDVRDQVIETFLSDLNVAGLPATIEAAVRDYVRVSNVSVETNDLLLDYFKDHCSAQKRLNHFRGLFASGILLHLLQDKRWTVNYGLHPERCMLAVPYTRKGVPAPNAEFGHPDVAIGFTCLSQYQSGLTDVQIRNHLMHLAKTGDPSVEYSQWIEHHNPKYKPPEQFSAVNLDNDHQCYDQLFPAIRYNKKLIDYHLVHMVFPKEGREFDHKISTSAWDLASSTGGHCKTGFSGTNDNQASLPLTIQQRDIARTKHTSALALRLLLRPANQLYIPLNLRLGCQLSGADVLECISAKDASINVLIDVGAQILDLTNPEVAQKWLQLRHDVKTCVYFDNDGTPMIASRAGKVEKLNSSYFRTQLSECLVYFDEQSTRGTDLRLPTDARAAVTLGPRLTKDRLVQACGRLRKLEQGQSLCFIAPPEVHTQIIRHAKKEALHLTSFDVLAWTMEQSCRAIERAQPLRLLQGLNYLERTAALDVVNSYLNPEDNNMTKEDADGAKDSLQEPEKQGLSDLYAPRYTKGSTDHDLVERNRKNIDPIAQELIRRIDSLPQQDLFLAASLDEEHEREISHEMERQTFVERPPYVDPLEPCVDEHLEQFIMSGTLEDYQLFDSAYDVVVRKTSIKPLGSKRHPWYHLRVSKGFSKTVKRPTSGFYNNYLRPVTFIVTNKQEMKPTACLIISPFEANKYLRLLQSEESQLTLHVYEPRVAKNMVSVDEGLDPTLESVEDWRALNPSLMREINLFAGQTYYNSYEDYLESKSELGRRLNTVIWQTRSFIRSWYGITRKGQDFTQTHIGSFLAGKELKKSDFE